MALSVLSEIKNHGLKPDLIHAHFAMPSGGAAAIVSKALGIPYVLTLHGSDVNVYPHYSKALIAHLHLRCGKQPIFTL